MERIAVVGPGLMGLGITRIAAAAGCEVLLLGRDPAAALVGRQRLAAQLEREVARGRTTAEQSARVLAGVRAASSDAELGGCTLAIESVPEERALKLDTLRRLQAALPPAALIASNTSGLPISGLARSLDQPERFLGLHFFSPVERMKLVEVVRGEATAASTLRAALDFVRRLGQVPVVVRDGPGFFTSRVFAAYLDEALALVGEGVPPSDVDAVARELGRAIGPLALLDDISLALNLQQIEQARADGLPALRCRPLGAPVLAAMVAAGRSGRRQGGGFYDIASDGARVPWSGLARLFSGRTAGMPPEAIAQRLRWIEAIEALHCLEEGVLDSADDADAATMLGLAYPRADGGVLSWVERFGLAGFVARAVVLAERHGERFRPSPWLRGVAAADGGLRRWRSSNSEGTLP
ncbi:MAG TPA: 3-hydroxyacyl-CoA dehydrogenase family protein [Rubrivivax sp.]|nr:3-hydroxyacyl-CoA dehydrogenase family protein [Rubrivivax sp.]